jgi:hypothetical protein
LKRGIDMFTIRVLALFVGATAAIASCPIPLGAQSAPAANQPDSVWIHISLQKSSYAIGEKPIAVLAIKDVSSEPIWFSNNRYLERIHVTRKDGEPPKTELYRHILGDFRPGDGPGLLSGPVVGRSIAPGSLDSQKYDWLRFMTSARLATTVFTLRSMIHRDHRMDLVTGCAQTP